MPLFQTSTRYRALQQLALVQLFQHFHGGVAAVVVDIHVVLPGDAAKGDDPFRPDALLQDFQHIGLAGIGGVDLQVGVLYFNRRRSARQEETDRVFFEIPTL